MTFSQTKSHKSKNFIEKNSKFHAVAHIKRKKGNRIIKKRSECRYKLATAKNENPKVLRCFPRCH